MPPSTGAAGLDGLSLFGQALFLDAASNSLDSVWSSGVSIMLAGSVGMLVLATSNSTAATGFFTYGNLAAGGPVLQID